MEREVFTKATEFEEEEEEEEEDESSVASFPHRDNRALEEKNSEEGMTLVGESLEAEEEGCVERVREEVK